MEHALALVTQLGQPPRASPCLSSLSPDSSFHDATMCPQIFSDGSNPSSLFSGKYATIYQGLPISDPDTRSRPLQAPRRTQCPTLNRQLCLTTSSSPPRASYFFGPHDSFNAFWRSHVILLGPSVAPEVDIRAPSPGHSLLLSFITEFPTKLQVFQLAASPTPDSVPTQHQDSIKLNHNTNNCKYPCNPLNLCI